MGRLVLAHGGTLAHYAGDGIFAFLNDPEPVPDHTAEAVQMALEMRDRFAQLTSRWVQSGFDVGLGIGLSVGFATVGRVGFEGYYGYAAIGSVSNMAARLCARGSGRGQSTRLRQTPGPRRRRVARVVRPKGLQPPD
jgi:adenylate cyclase